MVLHGSTLLISALPSINSKNNWRWFPHRDWFPIKDFEWRANSRKYFYFIILFYIPAFFLSRYIATALLLAFTISTLVAVFHDEYEPKEVILNLAQNGNILLQKMRNTLLYFHLVLLPHYIVYLILHFQYWYFLLFVVISTSTILLFAINYKYANYSPFRKRINAQVQLAVFYVGAIIPFLLPIAIAATIYQYRKAQKTINQFIHA